MHEKGNKIIYNEWFGTDELDIYPIYPKVNLSKRMQQAKVCPYLLRNAVIDKPNQA